METRDRLTLLLLVVATLDLFGCAKNFGSRSAADQKLVSNDPCAQKKPGDLCVPELPTVAPVVAGEGRIWGLFARRGDFEIREFAATTDGVLAKGSCPNATVAAALGALDQQPAVLCANFERGSAVFGRKLPNSQGFVWNAPELLTRDLEEHIKAISHFALLDRRLSVVYRTELKSASSGLASTQWRLQIAGGTLQMASQLQPTKPAAPAQSEILCPRSGVTRCDQPPVAAYVADGQMHVVLASGVAADRYLHLQQAPGKPSKVVPVTDVAMTSGKAVKSPCVSSSTNGNLKVFVPAHSVVSGLMNEHGERVGIIEHGTAAIAQGPDVYSTEDTQCPPEVSALAAFPNDSTGNASAKPRWLRATQTKDHWIVGYGVPPFIGKQGDATVSYGESFWVVRR